MPQYTYVKKPNWDALGGAYDATKIVASPKGWVYQPTGEVIVACRGLQAEATDLASPPTFTAAATHPGAVWVTGNTLTITVTASEAVRVNPDAYISVIIGANTRKASFDGATSTGTSLVFKYTVVAGDSAIIAQVAAGATILGGVYDILTEGQFPVSVSFTAPNLSAVRVNT